VKNQKLDQSSGNSRLRVKVKQVTGSSRNDAAAISVRAGRSAGVARRIFGVDGIFVFAILVIVWEGREIGGALGW